MGHAEAEIRVIAREPVSPSRNVTRPSRGRFVSLESADAPPSVSGHVSPSGAVNLDIRKGIARVAASGSLNGQAGSGNWKLGVLCSGRWTALKRGPVQASR